VGKVRALLAGRPELVHMDMSEHNEHRALHYAVLKRNAEIVRVLMEHGADPHKGIWPHRDATGALTVATDRGYDEIVEIINEVLRQMIAGSPLSATNAKIPGEIQSRVASLAPASSLWCKSLSLRS
jgi:hypothetical protein